MAYVYAEIVTITCITMALRNQIKKLQDQVEYILREIPDTRNSDKLLCICLWSTFYPECCQYDEEGKACGISFRAIMKTVPSPVSMHRIRASIQNGTGKNQGGQRYLPTDPKIARQRGHNIKEWRQALGYGTNYQMNI